MVSPFDVFLLETDADEAEITQAYRHRVKDAHLDQSGSISEFQRVQIAYAQLTAGYSVEDHNSERDDIDQHQR